MRVVIAVPGTAVIRQGIRDEFRHLESVVLIVIVKTLGADGAGARAAGRSPAEVIEATR